MNNRAEMDVEKAPKGHNKNFTTLAESSDKSVSPTNEHKDRGRHPDRNSECENSFEHRVFSPFVFWI